MRPMPTMISWKTPALRHLGHLRSDSMKPNMNNGLFLIVFLRMMCFFAAAERETALTCNITKQPDGSFLYHLSRPPSSSRCRTCWELQNKTVIARNSNFNPKLVQYLTNQSLVSKDCHAYLHYTADCKVWNEAHCHINCSHFLDVNGLHQPTVNSTLICLTESWCFTKLIFSLCVCGIILLVCVACFLLYWNICKCKRRGSAALYTLANREINMEEISVVKDGGVNMVQQHSG